MHIDSEAPNPVRSDIWFEDGNLVVQAQDTQFRAYKGVLGSRLSAILEEQMNNLGETSKSVEGCPLLYLPDSSIDVEHVFRAIFDRWSFPDAEALPFEVVVAFMRLGRKWGMKPLYDGALDRLSFVFPATKDEYTKNPIETRIRFHDPTNKERRGEIAIDTILLARELNLPCLLPAAFWYAATHVDILANDHANSISVADRHTILSAMNALRFAHAEYLFSWLDESLVASPNCRQTATRSCSEKKLRYSVELWKPPGMSLRFNWRPGAEDGLCDACVTLGREHHGEGAKRLWEELPSFFDLPSWKELLAAKAEGYFVDDIR
ncbi:hypothetical protein B0H11DRAFT_1859193 [Mycena galericulata]|nr:hypothetical protein B0H11DRAFT_2295598 [Mycena galericulata]KAJ7491782.1 hypothetical protein B0H11DRAFT_1859193 [Mycena galericulata]